MLQDNWEKINEKYLKEIYFPILYIKASNETTYLHVYIVI